MDLDLEQWKTSMADGVDPFSVVEKDLFNIIENKIKLSKQYIDEIKSLREENQNVNTKTVKKYEEIKQKTEDRLVAKQNERKCLYQEKLKELQSKKEEEEMRLKQETNILSDISNKLDNAVNTQKQLKEKKRDIKKKELSKKDKNTFELFTQTFQLYWTGESPENVNGYYKCESQVNPFCFKKGEQSRKEIIDDLWCRMES